jgi:hypothetical protein
MSKLSNTSILVRNDLLKADDVFLNTIETTLHQKNMHMPILSLTAADPTILLCHSVCTLLNYNYTIEMLYLRTVCAVVLSYTHTAAAALTIP